MPADADNVNVILHVEMISAVMSRPPACRNTRVVMCCGVVKTRVLIVFFI